MDEATADARSDHCWQPPWWRQSSAWWSLSPPYWFYGSSSQMACKATFNSSVVLGFGWSIWYFSAWRSSIGVARILSGGVLFPKKSWRLFLVIALKDRVNIPPNLSHQAKTVLKFTLALAGVHFVSWGCTFTFFL